MCWRAAFVSKSLEIANISYDFCTILEYQCTDDRILHENRLVSLWLSTNSQMIMHLANAKIYGNRLERLPKWIMHLANPNIYGNRLVSLWLLHFFANTIRTFPEFISKSLWIPMTFAPASKSLGGSPAHFHGNRLLFVWKVHGSGNPDFPWKSLWIPMTFANPRPPSERNRLTNRLTYPKSLAIWNR